LKTGALLTQAFNVLHQTVAFALLLVVEIGQEKITLSLNLVDQTVAVAVDHRSPFARAALKTKKKLSFQIYSRLQNVCNFLAVISGVTLKRTRFTTWQLRADCTNAG
jgi:hypothetical protein